MQYIRQSQFNKSVEGMFPLYKIYSKRCENMFTILNGEHELSLQSIYVF